MVLSPPSARRVDLPPLPRVFFDDSTVASAQRGSAEAWEVIYTHFGPLLTNYAASRGIADPEDVTQEVMSAAASRIGHFSGDSEQFRSWLFSIAHRRCADVHRRRYRRRENLTDRLPDRADPAGGADEVLWSTSEASEVMHALDILDERERQVITLRVVEEKSVADVASHTGLSAANVRVIQSRAMTKLRRYVENNGGVLDKRFRGIPVPLLALWERLRSRGGATAPAVAAPVVASSGWGVTLVATTVLSTVVGVAAVSASVAPADTAPAPADVAEIWHQEREAAGGVLGLTAAEAADLPGASAEEVSSEGDPFPGAVPPGEPLPPPPAVGEVLDTVLEIPGILDGSGLGDVADLVDLPGLLVSLGLSDAADLGAVGLVDDVADSALGAVGDVVADTGDAVGGLVGTVTDTVGDVTSTATDVLKGEAPVADVVEDTVETVSGTVDDAAATTGDLVDDVTDTTDDLVADVVESVEEAVDEIIGGLGGILGN